jgi:hypothetical protein
VLRDRIQLTSTGRELCGKCMAERNARRKAKKEELRRESKQREESAAAKSSGSMGVSFEDLMRGDEDLSKKLQSRAKEEEPAPAPKQPEPELAKAGTSFEDLMSSPGAGGRGSAAASDGQTRTWGLEGQPQEGSARLQLGPIDDNRPILGQSGHQPPSKKAYLAAFCLFGLAGAIFWTVAPGFREILMPWDTTKYAFSTGELATTGDTNALRNTSNISQFDVFSQGPIFFIAWSFVGVYVIGFVMIIWSVGKSMLDSYLAKRRLKKAEEYAKKHGVQYPG